MINKKGIPTQVNHSIKGCKKIDGVVYVPLDEIAAFCLRFSMLSGAELGKVVHEAQLKGLQTLPDLSKTSLVTKILKLFSKGRA